MTGALILMSDNEQLDTYSYYILFNTVKKFLSRLCAYPMTCNDYIPCLNESVTESHSLLEVYYMQNKGPVWVTDIILCRYGLLEAKNAGQSVADNIGFDSDGVSSTDPAKILDGGAIRNFTRCFEPDHSVAIFVLPTKSKAPFGRCIRRTTTECFETEDNVE